MENEKMESGKNFMRRVKDICAPNIKGCQSNKEEIELQERVLRITKSIVYRIELSSGGPEDYFEIAVDPETKEVLGGKYHYLNWFDGAHWFDGAQRNLSNEELNKVKRVYGPFVV